MLTLLKVESAESLLYEIYEENIEANLTTWYYQWAFGETPKQK